MATAMPSLLALAWWWRGTEPGGTELPEHTLELQAIFWIESDVANLQPSGLTIRGEGQLYAVSDKHAGTLFAVEFDFARQVARFVPAWHFQAPPLPGQDGGWDWEAVTTNGEDFFLASESASRILQVSPGAVEPGGVAPCQWCTPDLAPTAQRVGLLLAPGAGLEALAWIEPGHLVAGAERQPRGFLTLRTLGTLPTGPHQNPSGVVEVHAQRALPTRYRLQPGRGPDLTDLWWDPAREQLYGLARNLEAVVLLGPEARGYPELAAWSFAGTMANPELDYAGQERFGLAEGMAMDQAHIYLVLDANGAARRLAPGDRRPALLVFARPPPLPSPASPLIAQTAP